MNLTFQRHLLIIQLLVYIFSHIRKYISQLFLTPNGHYSGRTATLTSNRCILYIYSTNIGTEYFKHGVYTLLFFSSKCSLFQNSNVFGSYIIHILYTGCAKIKNIYIIPAPKGYCYTLATCFGVKVLSSCEDLSQIITSATHS